MVSANVAGLSQGTVLCHARAEDGEVSQITEPRACLLPFFLGIYLQEAEVFGAEGTHTSSQREAVVKDLGVSPLGASTQEVELPELLKSVGLLLGTQSFETS